jgi:hypothetical protein
MLTEKETIKKIFEAESILNKNLYLHGSCPSDLTDEQYLDDIFLIVNDENYKKELMEENENM